MTISDPVSNTGDKLKSFLITTWETIKPALKVAGIAAITAIASYVATETVKEAHEKLSEESIEE